MNIKKPNEMEQHNEAGWGRLKKNICLFERHLQGTKLKEFQFKFIHRIIVTKKELYKYGIKTDDECLYCGEHDSIDHAFYECQFVRAFVKTVIHWFNVTNNSQFSPTSEEELFGILSGPYEKETLRKFNYTILFMRYYIYTSKMHNKAIHLSNFVDKALFKYRIENLCHYLVRKNALPKSIIRDRQYISK